MGFRNLGLVTYLLAAVSAATALTGHDAQAQARLKKR
jgi:hypothetical protein